MDPRDPDARLLHEAARDPLPAWDDARALPWADPAFSARVLRHHLDPATSTASRPPAAIATHVAWLEERLAGTDGPVLDLCCGPGLYCHEHARAGRPAVGWDVAPAAIAWARRTAARDDLACTFFAADLADPALDLAAGGPFAAVTCWYGDLHAFRRDRAARLLAAAARHLVPGGLVVLELQRWEDTVTDSDLAAVEVENGLFADEPHLWVQRHRWDPATETEVHGHWIAARGSGTLRRYAQCFQAWRPDRLDALLAACGLSDRAWHAPVAGLPAGTEFPVLVARRAAPGEGP